MLSLLENKAEPRGFAHVPEVAYCVVKQRLIDAFLDTVREVTELEKQQIQAVIESDAEFSRFDLLIHFAREQKDMAKYAWIAHVESHGC